MKKVLHVTNELSEKNFSITSIILYILKHNKRNEAFAYFSNYSINSAQLSLFKKFFLDFLYIKNFFEYKKYNIVHIHGLWSFIQFFSIIISDQLKIKTIIHPHGMLLPEALKNNIGIRLFLKLLLLKILNKICNTLYFVAVTKKEFNSIKKYFPNSRIFLSINPWPFKIHRQNNLTINKEIVYFGRIHEHKNIHILIDAFIEADLPLPWKLKIYGIEDNNNYLINLKKKIIGNKNIEIIHPVFNSDKEKILATSWMNILISKSEVFSFSILESGVLGCPSLISQKLEVLPNDNYSIKSEVIISKLAKKIRLVSRWSTEYRQKLGEKISSFFLSNATKVSNYNDIYKKIPSISANKNKFKTLNYLNLIIIFFTYSFNLLFCSLWILILFFKKDFENVAVIGLLSSLWIFITQLFSANMRSIILYDRNTKLLNITASYRFYISLIFYLIYFLFFNVSNNFLHLFLPLFILLQWVFELKITEYEISKRYYFIYFIFLINLLLIAIIFFITNINYSIFFLLSYCLLLIFFLKKYIFNYSFFIKINFFNTIKRNLSTLSFFSSSFSFFSIFLWRLWIFFLFDKILVGIFYVFFSIGSLPGTLINSIIAPTMISGKYSFTQRKLLSLNLYIKILFFILLTLSIVFLIKNIFYDDIYLFKVLILLLSLIGSIFMCIAMFKRNFILFNKKLRNQIFKIDILYSVIISLLIPTLYIIGDKLAVAFAFLISSVIAFLLYSNYYKKL